LTVVIEPNNSCGIVFIIAVSYLTTVAYKYQASDEVIENEIQELLIVVQIRILSFVLRKEIFKTVTLAFCVVMKRDFKEDDFNFDYSQMNSYDHLDICIDELRKTGSYVTRSFVICRSVIVSVGY
jgi:hypothetical protein